MNTATIRCSMLIVVALCAIGCRHDSSNYCAGALNDNCLNVDAALRPCTSDQECAPNVCDLAGSMTCVQCTSAKPSACTAAMQVCGTDNMCRGCASDPECAPNVCDLAGSRTCVQCTSANPAACTATTPVCGIDDTCRACTAHAECGSNVCLADGSCAPDANVAYVAANGSGTTCSRIAPCATLDAGLQTDRPYVKLAAGLIKDSKSTTIDGKTVTILADAGAKLDRDGDGAILIVQSSGTSAASVQIFDVEITGATGTPGGDGVRLTANGAAAVLALVHVTIDGNQGAGVAATGGGSLTVSQSTIINNQGGGISISGGTFIVVGNVFFNNGGNTSLAGGISIGTAPNAANRLELNSFALNTSQDGVGPAIQCIAGTFTAKNNIMSANRTPTAPANQFGGTCTHTYSIAQPGALPPGTGNTASDPLFADAARGDLHLQSTSPARHAADPGSDLTGVAARDIDGSPRTSPADLGAYVFKAQARRRPAEHEAQR